MKTSPGINWYDKSGKKLDDYNEIEKLLSNRDYQIVKRTDLKNGRTVSTVWLGLDHSFTRIEGSKPIIFETMIFSKDGSAGDFERYSTEEEAKNGHEEMVKKYSN